MSLISRTISLSAATRVLLQRNLGCTAVAMQQAKADPIKLAFVDKVKEYTQKQKALGDQKLVDADADVNKTYQEELERVNRYYQVKNQDEFIKFPALQFEEPKIDSIDLHEPRQEDNLRW